MKFHNLQIIFILFVYFLQLKKSEGQTNKVSPKLDFDDAENKSNSSSGSNVDGMHGGSGEGRRGDDGRNSASGSSRRDGYDSGGSGTGTGANTSGGGSGSGAGKSGPKIHGVRVTVDTGDNQKSKESKESVEITDLGKHKKRVGIHTDITFEISANGDDANATSSAQRNDDKEDASVPIYKGRGGSSHHKGRKPYDTKGGHWNPNFSSERRSGHDSGRRSGGPTYGYYPQYPHNIPVYTGIGDTHTSNVGSGGVGGGVYHRSDASWNSYIPSWTTERGYNAHHYRPNSVTGHQQPNWKPCYCITSNGNIDNRRRRDNQQNNNNKAADDIIGSNSFPATSSVIQVVDGKIERPFSKK